MDEITLQRFIAKVSRNDDPCWLWTGAINSSGYGCMRVAGKTIEAHRLSYAYFVGKLLSGLEIDHLCRVRNCVNPKHLEQVTKKENMARGESPYAKKKRQTHCKNGHPFNEQNTYQWRGTRKCRACNAIIKARKALVV